MFRKRPGAAFAAAALSAGAVMLAGGTAAASAATARSTAIPGSAASKLATRHYVGAVSPASRVGFELVLKLRNPAAAQALVKRVSTPGSADYRHFLTAAQWEAAFSPSQAAVSRARAWLAREGFAVGATAADRITISASGTAAQVDHAFGVLLREYRVDGHTLREATRRLSVPASLAGIVSGAIGVDQTLAKPESAGNPDIPGSSRTEKATHPSDTVYPPAPPAFLTHPPCSQYYGQKSTLLTPPFGHGYSQTIPDVLCGYVPGQLRSAYGVGSDTGAGSTVAIIDAYGSATIDSDATQYFANNDPSNPFSQASFREIAQTPFDDESECGAPGWSTEQAIDVESVHAMAPDAHILYVGAQDCIQGLFNAEQYVIEHHLADIVTNSWADTGGDLFDTSSDQDAYEELFTMADGIGMTIQFSSGDDLDDFVDFGISTANFPSSSPLITAVGGTDVQINEAGQRIGELGWDEGRSFKCTANVVNILCSQSQLGQWLPASYDGGSGGWTSYVFPQPSYQQNVVPLALAERNSAIDGDTPMRVVPDISMEADPATGFLIGLTQTLPDGTAEYTQTRYGGTSLASPLLAGMIADAQQQAGGPIGFLNPTLYYQDYIQPTSIYDVVPEPTKEALYREDFAGAIGLGLPTTGTVDEVHELYYRGAEEFCDGDGSCSYKQEPLVTNPGYDSLTGLGSPGTNFIGVLASGQ